MKNSNTNFTWNNNAAILPKLLFARANLEILFTYNCVFFFFLTSVRKEVLYLLCDFFLTISSVQKVVGAKIHGLLFFILYFLGRKIIVKGIPFFKISKNIKKNWYLKNYGCSSYLNGISKQGEQSLVSFYEYSRTVKN